MISNSFQQRLLELGFSPRPDVLDALGARIIPCCTRPTRDAFSPSRRARKTGKWQVSYDTHKEGMIHRIFSTKSGPPRKPSQKLIIFSHEVDIICGIFSSRSAILTKDLESFFSQSQHCLCCGIFGVTPEGLPLP